MSAAFLPSPARSAWQLGPIPVRAYALCLVAGILVAVYLANRRYLRIGGEPGIILELATWAVPAGLIGARLYSVATDYELYFGGGRDWLGIAKISGGGLGLPGGLAAGAAAVWLAARRAGVNLVPVAGAAAPGVAFGLAMGAWGNWFSQQLYGRPSSLPWAVAIAPEHRVPGYESYATFQPTFLYGSLWDLAVGAMVIWAGRRFLLAGDRALALCLGADAIGRYGTESLRVDYAHQLLGLRVNQWVMIAVVCGAAVYLHRTRGRRGPDRVRPRPAGPPSGSGAIEAGALAGVSGTTRTGQV